MTEQDGNTELQGAGQGGLSARGLTWGIGALLALTLLLFGGRGLGYAARHSAARCLDVWALGDAMVWLERADWVDPRSPATELMRARCYRNLWQSGGQDEQLARARQHGAAPRTLENEALLGRIQSGRISENVESSRSKLIAAGYPPHEVTAAFVEGYIAQNELERAQTTLTTWSTGSSNHPHVLYLRGVLSALTGDVEGGLAALAQAIAAEPRHELAQLALAQIHEDQGDPTVALDLFLRLAENHPANDKILVGLARSLRKAGRARQALSVLQPLASTPEVDSKVAVEMGQLATELGRYDEALTWFHRADARDMTDHDALTAAATALAMLGNTAPASDILAWVDEDKRTMSFVEALEQRLAVDPGDRAAGTELAGLYQKIASTLNGVNPYQSALAKATAGRPDLSQGMQLYLLHCSACHADTGDGTGRAARFVFPRPRDLLAEPARLISGPNGNPTRADVQSVIRLGIPGTSMTPMEELTDQEIDRLVDVVLQMRQDGIRNQYLAMLREDGEPIDDADVDEVVRIRSTPDAPLAVPDIAAPNPASLAAGKELFVQQSCHSCHGETGTGDETTPLFDSRGRPSFPRDLVRDLFKGGNDAQSVYLRIVLGMPGTPHPANVAIDETQLIQLTQYCLALGREPKRALTNYQRAIEASRRPVMGK
ncbi:MAG: c-type cytochrome [Planctomycetes bacterium]|nr:c-type cytochrome [Planctomycetota bacterium]